MKVGTLKNLHFGSRKKLSGINGLWNPTGLAACYLPSHQGPFKAKMKLLDTNGQSAWVYLYKGNRRVWDCNYEFFKHWFVEVK